MTTPTGCCSQYRCRRSKPILIRQGGLSGRWYVITDWVIPEATKPDLIEARQKHDVTDELTAALIAAGWTPPS